jgi:2,5-dihydroxypyridine 5,6-dioxygenase
MLCVAHTGIGFNPGAAVVGSIIQDQRVMGSTTWGFGSIGAGLLPPDGVKAPSHSDAVSLNTTLEVDGVLWMKDGQFVERDLAPLAKRLKKE